MVVDEQVGGRTQREVETGERLLAAVERITRTPEQILTFVEGLRRQHGDWDVELIAPRIVSHFSNRSAVVGGATALPAFVPGIGSLAALAAGPLADMVMLLKFETELCMALTAAHGYDIRQPRERQLAFLLAAIGTAHRGPGWRYVAKDVLDLSGTALWKYTPRRVGKLLVTAFAVVVAAHLTPRSFAKHFFRAVPLIGVAVGAGMNHVLTHHVGSYAHAQLKQRRAMETPPA